MGCFLSRRETCFCLSDLQYYNTDVFPTFVLLAREPMTTTDGFATRKPRKLCNPYLVVRQGYYNGTYK
jgi:hypothetical protein